MEGSGRCCQPDAACCSAVGGASPPQAGGDGALVPAAAQAPAPARRAPRRVQARTVPKEISEDPRLLAMVKELPAHYNFEIPKTVWRVRQSEARRVALQFPEGLLLFAPVIAEILSELCGVESVLLGDVTYGACCVDDWAAAALGADFLVHYGHSCLVSIRECVVPNMMYVFVEIRVDVAHLVATVKQHFPPHTKTVLAGTIQFASCLRAAADELRAHFTAPPLVPQAKPLSLGEVLGCTSPQLPVDAAEVLIFIADGRFHLESMMIHNPALSAYLYNPYTKMLTEEKYDHGAMRGHREAAIRRAAGAQRWGVVLGTLGHQGSPAVLRRVERLLTQRGRDYVVVLLSEVFPAKLALFEGIEAWVQISCPRLSIDWGQHFSTPLLSAFEAECALGTARLGEVYPMDWYSRDGGQWAVYTDKGGDEAPAAAPAPV
eukprot:TRINITY_DN12581_c1_g1_i1.p2 TRINITY_DN12581_c1_g1~~TRINITY_DN12581_c1_g1_i1.p2  ORF type:complete len:433 (+),score=129.17 TRINITY_DN12581_c1_g1_i1:78-1376(+)